MIRIALIHVITAIALPAAAMSGAVQRMFRHVNDSSTGYK
jgi:hypothetical protein